MEKYSQYVPIVDIQALRSFKNRIAHILSEKTKLKSSHFSYKNLIKNFNYVMEIWTTEPRIPRNVFNFVIILFYFSFYDKIIIIIRFRKVGIGSYAIDKNSSTSLVSKLRKEDRVDYILSFINQCTPSLLWFRDRSESIFIYYTRRRNCICRSASTVRQCERMWAITTIKLCLLSCSGLYYGRQAIRAIPF